MMSHASRYALIWLHLLCFNSIAVAQTSPVDEEWIRVEVHVTAVAGDSVYIDLGRDGGLEPGDTLRLFPIGSSGLVGSIRIVSRSNARAVVDGDLSAVEIGTEGEVLIPAERRADDENEDEPTDADEEAPGTGDEQEPEAPADDSSEALAPPRRVVPDHPAWTAPPSTWDQAVPLLAPAEAIEPEEREQRIRGRWFSRASISQDDDSPGNRYTLIRSGLDVTVENPFEQGGEFELDLDFFHRRADVASGSNDSTTRFRPDRVSYKWGGLRHRPDRWQVGRFLQNEFPELGIIDGVEYGRRLESGDRFGSSFGWLPEPDDDLGSGDDLAAAVFYRWVADDSEQLRVGSAYQKTWHKGAADRDLLLQTIDYRPDKSLSLHGTAWIDHYTGADKLKSSGLELTQLQLNGRYTSAGGDGVGLSLSTLRWPDLLRDEFDLLTATQITDNRVMRVSLNGWHQASDQVRLSGRFSHWTDQTDSGNSANVRVTIRDMLYDDGSVSVSAFHTQGRFNSGMGLRTRATKSWDRSNVYLSWDMGRYDQSSSLGSTQNISQHTLRAGYDTRLDKNWNLSVSLEDRLGDGADLLTFDLMVQQRF